MTAFLRCWGCILGIGLLAGCVGGVDVFDPVRQGPFYAPRNFSGDPTMGNVRRVVLLPVCGGSLAPPETMAALDGVLAAALQGENRFEVVTFSREACLRKYRTAELSSAAALPHGFMAELQREFAVDAVLFVDLTVFDAYRPLTVGLRAKLADINGSRLIWTFDEVFAADNPAVANTARRHYLTGDRGGLPLDLTPGILQSPTRFTGFAAATMFATLPPVVRPAEAPEGRVARRTRNGAKSP